MKIKTVNATKKYLLEVVEVTYLLSQGVDSKTIKGEKEGVLTGILYFLPDDEICPLAELAGCREACLVTAGRAAMFDSINAARLKRVEFLKKHPDLFFTLLIKEIKTLEARAKKLEMALVIRLNGTSDIRWKRFKIDGLTIFEIFPDIQFYDYAKSPAIAKDAVGVDNYHVTLSFSNANEKYRKLILDAAEKFGSNLAVVFKKQLPEFYLGRKVINGDLTDLRFLDEENVVVGLKAKGRAKQDESGFVIDANNMIAIAA